MIAVVASLLLLAPGILGAPGILLIGDSTVTDANGWGSGFCADTKGLAQCVNLAAGGTTTVTWQDRTQYDKMITLCKTANTYATIQFGHNDQKVMTTAQFKANLTSVTKKIQNAGCSPILVTSLARRNFHSDGVTPTDQLGPYSDQTIAVAKSLKLPLLPLLADSMAYIGKLGKANAIKFNKDANDTTHLNALGALYFGRIVADEVSEIVTPLSSYIVANKTLSNKIAAGTL